MNFIVVCERIMELQPGKDDDERIINAVLEEFEWSYHHLLHCFPDIRSLVEPVPRIEEIVCIILMREAIPIPC